MSDLFIERAKRFFNRNAFPIFPSPEFLKIHKGNVFNARTALLSSMLFKASIMEDEKAGPGWILLGRVTNQILPSYHSDPARNTLDGHRPDRVMQRTENDSDQPNPAYAAQRENLSRLFKLTKRFSFKELFIRALGWPTEQKLDPNPKISPPELTWTQVGKNFLGMDDTGFARVITIVKNIVVKLPRTLIYFPYSILRAFTEGLPFTLQLVTSNLLARAILAVRERGQSNLTKGLLMPVIILLGILYAGFKLAYFAGRMLTSPLESLRAVWSVGLDDLDGIAGKLLGLFLVLLTLAAIATLLTFAFPVGFSLLVDLMVHIFPPAAGFIVSISAMIMNSTVVALIGSKVLTALNAALGFVGLAQIASSAALIATIGANIFAAAVIFTLATINYLGGVGYIRIRNGLRSALGINDAPAVSTLSPETQQRMQHVQNQQIQEDEQEHQAKLAANEREQKKPGNGPNAIVPKPSASGTRNGAPNIRKLVTFVNALPVPRLIQFGLIMLINRMTNSSRTDALTTRGQAVKQITGSVPLPSADGGLTLVPEKKDFAQIAKQGPAAPGNVVQNPSNLSGPMQFFPPSEEQRTHPFDSGALTLVPNQKPVPGEGKVFAQVAKQGRVVPKNVVQNPRNLSGKAQFFTPIEEQRAHHSDLSPLFSEVQRHQDKVYAALQKAEETNARIERNLEDKQEPSTKEENAQNNEVSNEIQFVR